MKPASAKSSGSARRGSIAGRLSATYSHDDPALFITCANRIFREELDLAAGRLEDFVPAPPADMDRSRSPRVLQPLTVGDTLTMPNGGVGVVTQIQGDQVTAGRKGSA